MSVQRELQFPCRGVIWYRGKWYNCNITSQILLFLTHVTAFTVRSISSSHTKISAICWCHFLIWVCNTARWRFDKWCYAADSAKNLFGKIILIIWVFIGETLLPFLVPNYSSHKDWGRTANGTRESVTFLGAKIGLKTAFWGKKLHFWRFFSRIPSTLGWGVPPFSLLFSASFSLCKRRVGGYPPSGRILWLGFLNPSLTQHTAWDFLPVTGISGKSKQRYERSAKAGSHIVDCPTRWSLWYWYFDFYVDHLYFNIKMTEKYRSAIG